MYQYKQITCPQCQHRFMWLHADHQESQLTEHNTEKNNKFNNVAICPECGKLCHIQDNYAVSEET